MNEILIEISTKYTSIPSYCKIYCCDEIVFDGFVYKNIKLDFQKNIDENFKLQIFKSGKTLELLKKKHIQELVIEKIILNGIELKIKEFGSFETKDNNFVKDVTLQTNICNLNGCWNFQLPRRQLIGKINEAKIKERFKVLSNADIACFGCSETQGLHIEENKRWPNVLGSMMNRNINNYGIGGSNINEITAFIKYYLKNFNCSTIIMLLPHTMRKQLYDKGTNEYVNVSTTHQSNKEIILHGEEHSVADLAGKLKNFCDNISNNKIKIFFSSTHRSEYNLFSKTPCKKYMLPLIDKDLFPIASDCVHGGIEYNRAFAESILNKIQ